MVFRRAVAKIAIVGAGAAIASGTMAGPAAANSDSACIGDGFHNAATFESVGTALGWERASMESDESVHVGWAYGESANDTVWNDVYNFYPGGFARPVEGSPSISNYAGDQLINAANLEAFFGC